MSEEPRRLHRAAIAVNALAALRDAALPLLIAFVAGVGFGGGGRSPGSALSLAGIGVLAAAGLGYWRWTTTTWWVRSEAVHLRTGLLSTDETVVPRGRIQAIDTTQGPLQRLFGVLELRVQTAGGGSSAEIALTAVTPADARELRAMLGLSEAEAGESDGGESATLSLGRRELLLAALTAPTLGVLVPVVAAVVAGGDEVLFAGLRRGWFDSLATGPAIAVGAAAVIAVAWLLSIVGSIVAFAGFTVQRDGDRLRIRRGLAQRRVASVPLARVHAVSVVEGVLRQPLGLAALRLETAGYRNEPAAAQTLMPLVRRSEIPEVLAALVPELQALPPGLDSPPGRARRRYVLPPLAAALTVAIAASLALPALWPVIPLAALAAGAYGVLRHHDAGYAFAGGRCAIRTRLIARRTLITRAALLQEHTLAQNPWQRRARLADLHLAVASGRRAGVSHIESDSAQSLFDELRAAHLTRTRPASRRDGPQAPAGALSADST